MNQIKILLGFGRNNIEEKLIKNVEDTAPLVLKDLVQCEEGKTEITVFGVPHILEAGQIIVM